MRPWLHEPVPRCPPRCSLLLLCTMIFRASTLGLLLLHGCAAADTLPAGRASVRAAPAVARQVLSAGRASAAAADPDGTIVVVVDGRATRHSLDSSVTTLEGALEGATTAAHSHGTVFVGGSFGLQKLGPWGFDVVPHVETGPITALVAGEEDGRDQLWLTTENKLFRYDDGALVRVTVDGMDLPGARLCWGPAWSSVPATWILSEGTLWAFVRGAARAFPTPVADDGEPYVLHELAADARGQLWARSDDHVLRRAADGAWTALTLPGQPLALQGSGRTDAIWVQTTAGLFQADDAGFFSLSAEPDAAMLGVDDGGRVIVSDGTGTTARSALPTLRTHGLQDGDRLDVRTSMQWFLFPDEEDALATVRLDGAHLPISPRDVEIDPIMLPGGPHELRIDVRWADGRAATIGLGFITGDFVAATWSDDVHPLTEVRCLGCHGDGGTAHFLDAPATFRYEFDRILENVEAGTMPLPPERPFTDDEIAVLRAWRAGGFLP